MHALWAVSLFLAVSAGCGFCWYATLRKENPLNVDIAIPVLVLTTMGTIAIGVWALIAVVGVMDRLDCAFGTAAKPSNCIEVKK